MSTSDDEDNVDDATPQVSHVFAANTPSSLRVKIAHEQMMPHIINARKVLSGEQEKGRRRLRGPDRNYCKKHKKIDPSIVSFDKDFDKVVAVEQVLFNKDCVSVCGRYTVAIIPDEPKGDSYYLTDHNGDLVAFKYSARGCRFALGKQAKAQCDALKIMCDTAPNTERGATKVTPDCPYPCLGWKDIQGGRDIHLSKWCKRNEAVWEVVEDMCKKAEHLFRSELPDGYRKAILAAKKAVDWKTIGHDKKTKTRPMYAAVATSRNYVSSQHKDMDFVFSTLQVHCPQAINEKTKKYDPNLPVAHRFVFGDFRVAFSMRPGDYLYFNSTYNHSLSEKTDAYMDKDVYVNAFYLRSKVVGGNNNLKPLDYIQTGLLETMCEEEALEEEVSSEE